MRTLVRYLLFFGVLVGLAFAAVTVEIDGQTLYRRYRVHELWPRAASWFTSLGRDRNQKPNAPAPKMRPTPKQRERVASLRRATREASTPKPFAGGRKTSVDKPISPRQKKALDDLVTSRISRR